jgi:hypothetical protein
MRARCHLCAIGLSSILLLTVPAMLAGQVAVPVPAYIPGGPDGYGPLWYCIFKRLTPSVSNPEELKSIKPNSSQLIESFVGAVIDGKFSCVDNLLKGGTDINGSLETTTTPCDFAKGPALHYALNNQRWIMAAYLLGRGADPNARALCRGCTALDVAIASHAPEDLLHALRMLRGGTSNCWRNP